MQSATSIHQQSQSGYALVFVLMLVLVSSILVQSQSTTARTDLKIAHNNELGVQAFALAEAGISHAYQILRESDDSFNTLLDNDGTGGDLATLGNAVELDGAGITFRHVNFGGLNSSDGYYVRLIDNNDEVPSNVAVDADNVVRLRSHGRIATAESIIEARLTKSTGYGLFAKTKLIMSGDARIDSYNSAQGTYAQTVGSNAVVGSNVNINLASSGVIIAGDAISGGTITGTGIGTITGNSVTGAPAITFDSVAPCGPGYSDTTGLSGVFSYNGTTGGDINVSGSNSITFSPGVYCFDKITLSGTSTLNVPVGPVEIYLTGASNLSGGGIMNTGMNPNDLKIYSSHTSLTVSGGSGAYASLYAPDAKINISGGSDFYGIAIGDEIAMSGLAKFHVDNSSTSGGDLEMLSWRQVQSVN